MLCASFMLRLHALALRPQLAEGGLGLSLTGKGSGCKNGPSRINSEFILNKNDELICWTMTLIFTGPWQD